MVLITTAVYLYKKHHEAGKKNEEIKELAHDGNFTLPDKVPSIPSNAEAGTHWRLGVDPAAKGAVHHDSDLQFICESRSTTDSCETDSSVDGLWDEVADMVECPTPRQSDYFDVNDMRSLGAAKGMRRGASMVSSRSGLQRSETRMSVMSAASTDTWTSRYSCMTDGRSYSEDDGDDGRSMKFFT
jgi:hypothetical protein